MTTSADAGRRESLRGDDGNCDVQQRQGHHDSDVVVAPLLLDNDVDDSSSLDGAESDQRRGCYSTSIARKRRRLLQAVAISAYLITWVANGEMLQGLSNGLLCPDGVAYDQPAMTTWLSYNYMILSGPFVVIPYIKFYRKWSMSFYVRHACAGRLGLPSAVAACAFISYMLQILNVTYIVGLECISVTLTNAIYQLQTPFTVGLSSCLLRDAFGRSDAVGILLSTAGVLLVVLPPLFAQDDENNGSATNGEPESTESPQQQQYAVCASDTAPMSFGVVATVVSAAIGGTYLVLWRMLDECRHDASAKVGRLAGFIDTHMTLATIGFCNLVFEWPVVVFMHWTGMEHFRLPPTPGHWWILNWNGLVEYAFDASCAAAIYMTSPVVTAIVAPMTIPLSLAADGYLWGTSEVESQSLNGVWMWLGVLVILLGVILLETKPEMNWCVHRKKYGKRLRKAEKEALLV